MSELEWDTLRQKVQRLLDLSGYAPKATHAESKRDADDILSALEDATSEPAPPKIPEWDGKIRPGNLCGAPRAKRQA